MMTVQLSKYEATDNRLSSGFKKNYLCPEKDKIELKIQFPHIFEVFIQLLSVVCYIILNNSR